MPLIKPPLAPGYPRATPKIMASPAKKKAPKQPAQPKAQKKKASAKPAKATRAPKKPETKKAPAAAKKASKPSKANGSSRTLNAQSEQSLILPSKNHKAKKLDPFTRSQKDKLLQLRDAMVD